MKLDAYDMVIKYRPGKANSNTHTLSRYPLKSKVVAVLQTNGSFIGPLEENQEVAVNLLDHCNILDDIKLAQRQNKNYSPLISFIQNDIQPDDEVLHRKLENLAKTNRVINGKLYRVRKFEEDFPLKNNLNPHLLIVVAQYVRSCDLCQRFKAANEKKAGLMQSHVVQSPWNTIGIDLTDPLPKTPQGNAYILVVIDYFTKWVELFPLRGIKSKKIVSSSIL
ncbi:unnamed protein product [Didymodactylos carnosus]|uniref:Integrase catalytic domain-containing protein n=1 Tax=Didymodactylos carnosus TaxID=1234261 RepID=A0A8S2YUW2_9BILA|nr:unnamed protein product [Didymodactylos carnosus]